MREDKGCQGIEAMKVVVLQSGRATTTRYASDLDQAVDDSMMTGVPLENYDRRCDNGPVVGRTAHCCLPMRIYMTVLHLNIKACNLFWLEKLFSCGEARVVKKHLFQNLHAVAGVAEEGQDILINCLDAALPRCGELSNKAFHCRFIQLRGFKTLDTAGTPVCD